MIQYDETAWISKSNVIEIYIFEGRVKFVASGFESDPTKVAIEFEESFLTSFGIDSNKIQGIKKRQKLEEASNDK